MKICGIVSEYNPFHTGHAHHIMQTRRALGKDTAIVCAMSGNYVQRGDFAMMDKYARAKAAIYGGADLVIELPLAAALSSAEDFARGAVAVLHALGCDTISFGAETADTALITRAAQALDALPLTGDSAAPLSYAAQRQAELSKIDKQAAALLDNPNNTLAIEYCRAMRPLAMQPLAIARLGAAHDAAAPHGGFASASLLRAHLRADDKSFCIPYLPSETQRILREMTAQGAAPVILPEQTLLAMLRDALRQGRLVTGARDGFDKRLQKAVYQAVSFSDAVERARTRRFPAARVRRALLRNAIGIAPGCSVRPTYLRVLAIGQQGRTILRHADTDLPLIVKPTAEKRLPAALQRSLALDAFADDLYALALPNHALRGGGSHFQKTPFCLK